MITVGEVMTREIIKLDPDESIYEAAKKLRESNISGAPVVEEGKVIGLVSEADIMALMEDYDIRVNTILPSPFDVLELPVRMKLEINEAFKKIRRASTAVVRDIMTKGVITTKPDEDITIAARKMSDRNINRLPVVNEKGEIAGIITRGDIIASL